MINSRQYWKAYNNKSNKLVKKIVKFNKKFEFNFIENSHYNHTRDILAVCLASFQTKKKINVLDYGSNILTLANLSNKINFANFFFTIYDPFKSNLKKNVRIKKLKYKIFNNTIEVNSKKFDIINFGSSIQYLENFYQDFDMLNISKTKYLIFTSTPISLSKTYESRQTNHTNLVQKIYSYKNLLNFLDKKKFKLIFKSRNNDKFIACKKKKYKTFSLNLIFRK